MRPTDEREDGGGSSGGGVALAARWQQCSSGNLSFASSPKSKLPSKAKVNLAQAHQAAGCPTDNWRGGARARDVIREGKVCIRTRTWGGAELDY